VTAKLMILHRRNNPQQGGTRAARDCYSEKIPSAASQFPLVLSSPESSRSPSSELSVVLDGDFDLGFCEDEFKLRFNGRS
jgi:hypothetical protein